MRVSRRTTLAGLVAAPLVVPMMSRAAAPDYTITPTPVADGIWMIAGADEAIAFDNGGAIANIAIIATPAGTVLVDSGPSLRYGQHLKHVAESLTGRSVVRVYVTHLHPDHGMGIGAFAPEIVAALPGTISGMSRDGQGFSDQMYRLLGDWMRGTDLALPGKSIGGGEEDFGGRRLRLLALSGHSAADLVVLDEQSGTLIGGDLLFHDRAPATPTADLARWRQSLTTLEALPHKGAIPGHGPYDGTGQQSISQTRRWIDWLDTALTDAVRGGMDMVEAGSMVIPDQLRNMACGRYELQRSVSHFYPMLEAKLLPRVDQS